MATHALPNNRNLFNRSAIMHKAWAGYNAAYNSGTPRRYPFQRSGFAYYLSRAWADAKQQARTAQLKSLTGKERQARIDVLNAQHDSLMRQPFGMSATDGLSRVSAELRQLQQAA